MPAHYPLKPGDDQIMITIPLDVAKRLQNQYIPLDPRKMERAGAPKEHVAAVMTFQAAIEAGVDRF